jgi:hypothetical protein
LHHRHIESTLAPISNRLSWHSEARKHVIAVFRDGALANAYARKMK